MTTESNAAEALQQQAQQIAKRDETMLKYEAYIIEKDKRIADLSTETEAQARTITGLDEKLAELEATSKCAATGQCDCWKVACKNESRNCSKHQAIAVELGETALRHIRESEKPSSQAAQSNHRQSDVGVSDDPTPWCHGCGSMTKDGCHCGPIAEND